MKMSNKVFSLYIFGGLIIIFGFIRGCDSEDYRRCVIAGHSPEKCRVNWPW